MTTIKDMSTTRHALVTGGARGIGRACAHRLLADGCRVTLLGRNAAALALTVDALRVDGEVQSVAADIADEAAVKAAFDEAVKAFGPVDILVNNAGQAIAQRFDRSTASEWEAMLAVNLMGTFHCTQAALDPMLAKGWGRIVNVTSTAGLIGYA